MAVTWEDTTIETYVEKPKYVEDTEGKRQRVSAGTKAKVPVRYPQIDSLGDSRELRSAVGDAFALEAWNFGLRELSMRKTRGGRDPRLTESQRIVVKRVQELYELSALEYDAALHALMKSGIAQEVAMVYLKQQEEVAVAN